MVSVLRKKHARGNRWGTGERGMDEGVMTQGREAMIDEVMMVGRNGWKGWMDDGWKGWTM